MFNGSTSPVMEGEPGIAASIYEEWKGCASLPIECLVNTVLLFKRQRMVIQMDVTFYTGFIDDVCETIQEFVNSVKSLVISHTDSVGNIVLYLKSRQKEVETALVFDSAGCVDVSRSFRTAAFADLLDLRFYAAKAEFPAIFEKPRSLQVQINVIQDERRSGALLVMMCDLQIEAHVKDLYSYFATLSIWIEAIDPKLQTNLTFHTKPGLWKESPELVVDAYRCLPTLV